MNTLRKWIIGILIVSSLSIGIPYSLLKVQAFDDEWQESRPDGDLDDISQGDDQMRQDKRAIRERLEVDHDWRNNETGITTIGYHKALHLIDQVYDTSDNSTLYNKGGDLYYQDATPNVIQITKNGALNTNATAIISTAYPIGSIYISTVSTNPGTLFGIGTWTAFGTGRVLVGINASDTDFDVVKETGGAKNVTLTAAQSGLPAHSVPLPYGGSDSGANAGGYIEPPYNTATLGGTSGQSISISAAAAAEAHSVLQPYIVVYMWERTA